MDQRTRTLREALKIPTGPRGVHAPHMDIGAAALHVLAMVSRRPADAADVAWRLFDCKLVRHPLHPGLSEAFQGEARSLATFLLMAMNRGLGSAGFAIKSFEFQEDGSYAWMNFDRRSLLNLRFVFSSHDAHANLDQADAADLYRNIDSRSAGNRFVIGAERLVAVGHQILMDCPEDSELEAGIEIERLVVATDNDGREVSSEAN
ncbi:hypothetical protein [Aliihoeflea aestuarii]|uniref:hypothetical protein n=1 Tax=Aliihoeflea aestuarii TaxID=453840 RepID=UPI00209382E5|nr:hypothetical protein [Aliihoeflea aestuarii]